MIILLSLLSLFTGFALGRASAKKRVKHRSVKAGKIFDVNSFLSYDGSEQTK